ncbi:MAG: S41 family peptidase [Meiothermus sp.]|uniref:S41 family peptidase n=1 Tax=Meiothermus sp. TaxID=1955249 RepID=UPI00298F224C|nr:S41 family peptidase [Meiothermus sp.]MDW8482293.1 S41 family peptidase [Meiothermus sp.]
MKILIKLSLLGVAWLASLASAECKDYHPFGFFSKFYSGQNDLSGDQKRQLITALWSGIRVLHVDPSLGGRDWNRLRDEATQAVLRTESDAAAYAIAKQMVLRLADGHSRLFTPSDFARHEGSDRPLEIGLYTVKKGGLVVVASVEDNSPAAKAGLRRGDVVQAVNGSSCAIEETLSVLQGSRLELRILRGDQSLETVVHPVPAGFESPPVFTEIRGTPSIFYVRIKSFAGESFAKSFASGLSEIASTSQVEGLIIDLRGNRGGSSANLKSALSHFVEGDVGEASGRIPRRDRFIIEPSHIYPYYKAVKLVILIDEGTNSAAELFAYILRTERRALLIGAPTAGNAQGVATFQLGSKLLLNLEIAHFHLKGVTLHSGFRINPDIEVDVPWLDYRLPEDPLVQRAVEEMRRASW